MEIKRLKNTTSISRCVSMVCMFVLLAISVFTFMSCSSDDDEAAEIYTITFDADGGTPVPPVQKVEAGKTVTAPSPNPTKEGYVFVYWHLSGSTTAYNFQTPVKNDITLKAKWQEEATAEYWQVAWELNGGAWPADDNHTTQVVKGGTLSEPNAPTKTGSTFEGWYKESALTSKVAFPYDVSSFTNNFTLYAKWKTGGGEPEKGIAMVASGAYCYYVLNADGTLYATGRNNYGQLGNGGKEDAESLIQVATGVAEVVSKVGTTFILKTDGTLLGVGSNKTYLLGLGEDDTDKSNFTPIPVNNVKAVSVGYYHTQLLKKDGSVWAAGNTGYGGLGVGDEKERKEFSATNLTSDVVAVSAGYDHSLALKKDGTVWAAGDGYVLGKGGSEKVLSFIQIFSGAKAIATGGYHSLVLKDDGTVYGLGLNVHGELGVGSDESQINSFTQAIDASGATLNGVVAIAAGYDHSLALKSDGTLWATGYNSYGQLDTGDGDNRTKFTQVASGIKSVSAGNTHTVVVKKDGTSAVWGTVNIYDCLNNGTALIQVKANDTQYYQYIRSVSLLDIHNTQLLYHQETIATGGTGLRISVKPGVYNLAMYVSNDNGVRHDFKGITLKEGQTVTITYERYSSPWPGGYKWVTVYSK